MRGGKFGELPGNAKSPSFSRTAAGGARKVAEELQNVKYSIKQSYFRHDILCTDYIAVRPLDRLTGLEQKAWEELLLCSVQDAMRP